MQGCLWEIPEAHGLRWGGWIGDCPVCAVVSGAEWPCLAQGGTGVGTGAVSVVCQGQGCDVLRMHHEGGPDGLSEAGGTASLESWRPCEGQHSPCPSCPVVGQPQAPVCAGGCPAGKRLARKGLGHAGGHQVEHKPSVCPHGEAKSLWSCIASRVSGGFFLSLSLRRPQLEWWAQHRRWGVKKGPRSIMM